VPGLPIMPVLMFAILCRPAILLAHTAEAQNVRICTISERAVIFAWGAMTKVSVAEQEDKVVHTQNTPEPVAWQRICKPPTRNSFPA
jgi:hypothetical protein